MIKLFLEATYLVGALPTQENSNKQDNAIDKKIPPS